MSIFFTDTDCELWHTFIDEYDIQLIKMPYNLDGKEDFYDMGKTDSYKHFFKRMREGAVPTTQALNPQLYYDYFEPVLKAGNDILYVHFSDQMSGTFEYMRPVIADLKKKYPKRKITTFDTKSICWGGGFQVLEAAKMHKAGKTDEEIIEFLKDFTKHVNISFVVENLTYLKRGGRLSATSTLFGKLLNIKPILKFNEEGKIIKSRTASGLKAALTSMLAEMVSNIETEKDYPIYLLNADAEKMGAFFEEMVRSKLPNCKIEQYPIGPVIGAHCGPGTIGLVYYGKKRI